MICVCGGLIFQEIPARGFSLLGPFEDWMQPSNDFRLQVDYYYGTPGVIGGPMCISDGYRWNVPLVTYGFDQSFLNFFGSNGVAAVEGAIQILNDLPPASGIVLTDYPYYSQLTNGQAQTESLCDLQSATLSLLLEQLGLASPTRSVYVLQGWEPCFTNDPDFSGCPEGVNPVYVVMRNFDPLSLVPSDSVNAIEYAYIAVSAFRANVDIATTIMEALDSLGPIPDSAVADNQFSVVGGFYTGLTSDDVGGFCYLYSTNNVNYESLVPGVSGTGANVNMWVNGAWRPGVDKIAFVRQPCNSSNDGFLPTTNLFTDTYVTNGALVHQQVQRVITQPDFLFSCADTGQGIPDVLPYARSGTSNWINNATLNGRSSGAGPGVILPPVKITFANMGGLLFNLDPDEETAYNGSTLWGTYDQSTNAPIVYPLPKPGTNQLTVRLWLFDDLHAIVPTGQSFELSVIGQVGKTFLFQTSSNLTDWVSLGTNQVNGSVWTFLNSKPSSQQRFYRLVPQ
jgi:hypothetical protein